jgi:hypothetical protein
MNDTQLPQDVRRRPDYDVVGQEVSGEDGSARQVQQAVQKRQSSWSLPTCITAHKRCMRAGCVSTPGQTA